VYYISGDSPEGARTYVSIKALISPAEQGNDGDRFTWTDAGELVTPENFCPCVDLDCHRAFIGVDTRRGTTVAVVAELPLTVEQVTEAIVGSITASWGEDLREHAEEVAADVLERASRFGPGTRVVKDPEDGWVSEEEEAWT
jgi:hypothetical protein